MATDIAFALGVLALIGKSVPASLKVFLLTLAIADDVGAIAVIAVFYSGGIQWPALLVSTALLAGVAGLRWARVFWGAGLRLARGGHLGRVLRVGRARDPGRRGPRPLGTGPPLGP